MLETNLEIINDLKQFIYLTKENQEVLQHFTYSPSAFTRDRKLGFDRVVLFIAKLCKKTLSIELDNFFQDIEPEESCTTSAFCQQRKKLQPVFFNALNEVLLLSNEYHNSSTVRRWEGYRLIAVDGSNVPLIKLPELENYFGGQCNQQGSFVQAKTFYYYDLLNGLVLSSFIGPYRTAELTLANEGVKCLQNDMLTIYDRNFFNFKMMALHLWIKPEVKFVIRAKEKYSIVKSFIESNLNSVVIEMPITSTAIKGLTDYGFSVNRQTTIKIRMVRVELENEVEVLATNLWEEEGFDTAIFKELYNQRWGIETQIDFQKNKLQLECFSGQSIQTIEQDFYATVFISNLYSILIKDAQNQLDKSNGKRKYPRKVNNNKSQAKLRRVLTKLFMDSDPTEILKKLILYFIRDPLPIRKGRSFPRKSKSIHSKSKHRSYSNYKMAC